MKTSFRLCTLPPFLISRFLFRFAIHHNRRLVLQHHLSTTPIRDY